jgi:hypothetical protein
MARHGAPLGRRQEAAIAALVSSRTNEEAAREARVTSRTLRRWLKHADFRQRLHEARSENFARDCARLQQGTPAAVKTLLKTLVDERAKESLRVGVAKFVIESTQKSLEIEGLDLRISQLEQKLAEGEQMGGDEVSDVDPEPDQTC